jgi:hypothetical protein
MNLTIPYPDSLPDALRLSRAEFEQEARRPGRLRTS